MTVLGVDFGLRRIGMAFSDAGGRIAFAGPILTGGEEESVRQIAREAESRKAEEIVIGLPRNMDGSEGEMSVRARAFAKKLQEQTPATIVMWDERLTTVHAKRAMLSAAPSKKKRKKRIDSLAAQFILQNYLDSKYKK